MWFNCIDRWFSLKRLREYGLFYLQKDILISELNKITLSFEILTMRINAAIKSIYLFIWFNW